MLRKQFFACLPFYSKTVFMKTSQNTFPVSLKFKCFILCEEPQTIEALNQARFECKI